MPYCSTCGFEINEGMQFCPNCGTPVGPSVTTTERRSIERREKRPISTLAIVLIVVFVSAAVIGTIAFLPVRAVDIGESRNVQDRAGVDSINLDFTADVARVDIAFEDLDGKLLTLQLALTGRAGILAPSNLFDLTFDETIADNVLTVTSELDIVDRVWPSSLFGLSVTCDIQIDRSMNASLTITTGVGEIVMSTTSGVVLNALSLETTTGSVEANLEADVIVSGDISIKSTTGRAKLDWNKLVATKDLLVNVITTTGGVDVSIEQDERMTHNITLNAETTTGGVGLTIDIQDTIGAILDSSVTTGGIDVNRQVGFVGTAPLLSSNNYPAGNNFDIHLTTTTGGIDIDAKYTP